MDWVGVISEARGGGDTRFARASRTIKVLKMFRILRALRLLKLPGLMMLTSEKVLSDNALLAMAVMKVMTALCCLIHTISCVWYLIGRSGTSGSWLVRNDI